MATKGKQAPKSETTAVATRSGPPVVQQAELPDYIKTDSARGNEGVGTADLVIPRLDVVQSLSPYRKKGDPKQIAGVEEGDLVNSVTLANYGDKVLVVPVLYKKEYLVWRDRKLSKDGQGGFFGAYGTLDEADARAHDEGGKAAGIIVIDTPQNFCLLVDMRSGKAEEIVISMPRSKAKIARQWNSLIKLQGGDRFSRAYQIGTAFEKGQKGDFYNFSITQYGFPSKTVYMQADKLYRDIAAGVLKVQADRSDGAPGGDVGDDAGEM